MGESDGIVHRLDREENERKYSVWKVEYAKELIKI